MQITTIGLDIAKNVFQVHGIDAKEKVVVRKQLRRDKVMGFFKALSPCLIGMEACATAHYWARELTKLGHEVRLMPPKDVKAYLKRNKNDAADAAAICEAVRRPTMRFVRVKSEEQCSSKGTIGEQASNLLGSLLVSHLQLVAMERGSILDEYLSVPEFHGPLPPGDVVALAANPTVLHRLTGADPSRVRAVIRTATSPTDLPSAPELAASIAAVLGLPPLDR